MDNVAANRIKNQIRPTESLPKVSEVVIQTVLAEPISEAVLRAALETLLEEKPIVVVENKPLLFNHIWDFVEWYGPNREKFNDQQKIALDTLIQVRDMVNNGCGCKRKHREDEATKYFNEFWTRNKTTDLVSTVYKISGASQLQISNLVVYPTQE